MGDCSFCGQSAGFLRGKHKECKAKHNYGWTKIVSLATNSITGQDSVEAVAPPKPGQGEEADGEKPSLGGMT